MCTKTESIGILNVRKGVNTNYLGRFDRLVHPAELFDINFCCVHAPGLNQIVNTSKISFEKAYLFTGPINLPQADGHPRMRVLVNQAPCAQVYHAFYLLWPELRLA